MTRSYEFEVHEGRIHCDGCEGRIISALGRLDGVTSVEASHETQRVRVGVEDRGPEREVVARRLADVGFPVSPRT